MIYNLNELCIYIKNLYNVEYSEIIIGETHDRPNIIEDFEVLYTPTNAPQTIVITNVITNEVIEFNSLRKASEYLNIDKKIIKKLIQTKRLFKNIYSLKYKNTGLPVE